MQGLHGYCIAGNLKNCFPQLVQGSSPKNVALSTSGQKHNELRNNCTFALSDGAGNG